jgi:hypothetical protein
MIPRCFAILAVAILMVGCNRWDSKPGDYVRDTNAMTDVSQFVSTFGWNSSTNVEDLYRWEILQPHYIHDLPWSTLRNQKIQALTHGGILYVLSNAGWYHDYAGIAYNPQTNRFPAGIGLCFKPIGEHWYVWAMPDLRVGKNLPKTYE